MVKWPCDQEEDFTDSMVEMMNENGIRRYEDLQDLLACYLSLNAEQHHGAIVDAFRQVSLDFLNNDPCIASSSLRSLM